MTAAVLWAAVIVIFAAGRGERSIAGPIKGADFLQFYTMGSLARTGNTAGLYEFDGFHQAQVALVPESSPELYPPVYPPHASLVFAPFSRLAFRPALLLWSLTTIVGYTVVVRSAWRPVAAILPDAPLVMAAAAAFPPFYYLVSYGQATILILMAFWAGWIALERNRFFLAGMAFGLLLIKPQLALPLVVVVLACGEWALLAGAVTAVAFQAAIVALILGAPVLEAYVAFVPSIVANADLLEPKPFMSHSIRAVTRLAPDWVGVPLWIAMSAVVLTYVVKVWRSQAPVRVRLGMVMVASVLISPHLFIYDAVILALPLIWFAAYVHERGDRVDKRVFGAGVYWLFVMLLVPSAAVIGVQLSVPIVMLLAFRTARLTQPAINCWSPAGESHAWARHGSD